MDRAKEQSGLETSSAGPLAGLLVVALEQAVAAPLATRHLADLGARVVKIERPDGGDFARDYDRVVEGMSSYFIWLNRSKESVTLNLKHPRGVEVLRLLLERADVFVQNLAPGATDRLGFSQDTLARELPRVVTCDISGYGSTGPYAERRAYDLLVQCEAGLVSVTGTPDAPAKVGISVVDISAGMHAVSAILAALFERERTGVAPHVDVNLFDSIIDWMAQPLYATKATGRNPERTGARHASIAPYGPFKVGDGATVQLAVQNNREWERLCVLVLERPDLVNDERFVSNSTRVANVDLLTALLEEHFATRTTSEVREALDSAQIANASLNSVADVLAHPQLTQRDRWSTADSPIGPLQLLRPPTNVGGRRPPFGAVPGLGQHTRTVLGELGYSELAIGQFSVEGVI
jgi:itaconate CoA-transferase